MYPGTASNRVNLGYRGSKAMSKPLFTFKQFKARFPDDNACLAKIYPEAISELRWVPELPRRGARDQNPGPSRLRLS